MVGLFDDVGDFFWGDCLERRYGFHGGEGEVVVGDGGGLLL